VVANTTAGAIVLMHDTVAATVDAVPGIVSDLRARGFTLVTVETLVPWMEPGDVVYSRGRVLPAATEALAPESAPQLVDEAPFPPAE
jgi:peptidoglycan-N-acetylglucosamine deacetylase